VADRPFCLINWLIRQTASRKVTGPDEVPAELFKAGGETVLDRMHRICVAIWETDEWPEEWTFSILFPLPKKGDLKQCANYRTIALVSYASKIILRIILDRIRVKTLTDIADEQGGFRQGRGQETKSQISEYWCTRHASTSNHSICALQTSRRLVLP